MPSAIYILMAPSETKSLGGNGESIGAKQFIFPELYHYRKSVADIYNKMVARSDNSALASYFGIKKAEEIEKYKLDIFNTGTKKAIERYTGVAFDYLDYPSLSEEQKHYIDQQTLLFSNLFGPILAQDALPLYKFKQGTKLFDMSLDRYYKEHFSEALDGLFASALIVDLRAGIYQKFYTIKQPYITFKFLKEGKVVSHWAKAYRGKLLRLMALHAIESIESLLAVFPEDMKLIETTTKGFETLYTIEVGC